MSKQNKPFEGVELEESKEIHFAEHEVLMSFSDDIGAEAFRVWWNSEGSNKFRSWCTNDEYFKGALE